MSNFLSSRGSFPHFWKGKNPGVNEFNILLNALPGPAVILEARQNHILTANSEFLRLTAYAVSELSQLELRSIFPDISRYELLQPGQRSTTLTRHLRDAVDVVTESTALDAAMSWYLVQVNPQQGYEKRVSDGEWQQKYGIALQTMYQIISQPDLQTSLEIALQSSQETLNSRLICVYQFDSRLGRYQKAASTESATGVIFPDTIDANAMQVDTQVDIWSPGKRVTHDLHRIARIANLQYLAIQHLLQEGTGLGILIAADTDNPAPSDLDQMMPLVCSGLSAAIYHHLLVQNINSSLNDHHQSLLIRDTVLENAQEGIILVNRNLTIDNLNPAAEMILGYAASEVIGFPVENILVGTDFLIPALNAAMDGIPTHNLGNISLHRRSGQPFPAHLQSIPVAMDEGLLSIVILIRDISENEQIRVRTQQLEQRAVLGEVTAIFAHEVRNPINNISTGLQLLQTKFDTDDPNQDLISRLQHDCNRLTHLMESVLSFSRPMEYKMDPVNLDVLLCRLLERWRPRFAKANVQAYYQIEPGTQWVTGDARALEQVFTNLISNAVQAMKNGGVLAVKVANMKENGTKEQVEVTISDNGPGIPDEIKDHIFEPFVTNNPQGTGLGLAITKRIINAHRGSIHLTSFPGGTVFYVSVPGCKPNPGEAA